MQSGRSDAIVLQSYASRERDKLVVFLTPESGIRKGWAYGARSLRSRFGASLEPLSKVSIRWRERENEEVVRIESTELIRSLFDIYRNLESSAAAAHIVELTSTFAQPDEPSELLFRLVDRSCEALLNGIDTQTILTWTDIQMLRVSGIFPSIKVCYECERSLTRPIRYHPEHEGFFCSTCGHTGARIVPNDIVDTIQQILRLPIEELAAAAIDPRLLTDARSLAITLRRTFLGHELKSQKFETRD